MLFGGDLPKDWKTVTVEDIKSPSKGAIVSGPFGSNIGKKFFVEEGIPVIRGNNLTLGKEKFIDNGFVFITEEKAYELRNCTAIADDIIFTAAGTLGQVGIIPKNADFEYYIISNKQLRLRVNPIIADPLYVYYWFSTPYMREYIVNQNTGASIPLITLGTLRRLKINLPPLQTQRKIASILSAYDDLIENNTRRIRILEEMAQAIYREWFVNFRFPGHEGVRMVESPLGPIPEGWEVRQLGNLVELAYGKGLKADVRKSGQIPVYGSGGVVGYHDESLVSGPGIIVGRKGNVGSIFWSFEDFYPIDTVFYVKTDLPLLYVYYNLHDQNFINNDAAVPGLSRNQAYLLPFLLPQLSALKDFNDYVYPIFKQVYTLQKKNTNLRQQRDLLLPRLVSGEMDVSQININGDG